MSEHEQPGRQGKAPVRRSAGQTLGSWRWMTTIAAATVAALRSACSSDDATDPSRSSYGSDRSTGAQRLLAGVRGGVGCRGPRFGSFAQQNEPSGPPSR